MKTFLALTIPAAGILAALSALGTGPGAALIIVAVAVGAFWRFAIR